jgi:pilus assembly protein CpaB
MDKRKLMLLLLGAMVVPLGSVLAMRSMTSGHVAPVAHAAVPAPTGPRVLVAQRALPVGTIITPDAVAFQAWPRDMVQDAYFLDGTTDKTKLIGTVVRNPVTAGQPLTQGALVAPGDRGFLAAALGPGMRAVTIPVSDMSGVAGFIFPGDHVDMMLTQSVKSANPMNSNAMPLAITETVLRNLRVLATDQTTQTEVAPGGKSVVKTAHDVTLEVTPRIAEKIEVAQTLGSLSLALRALADNQSELDQAIASGALKLPSGKLKLPANASTQDQDRLISPTAERTIIGAANRPVEGATTFSTGGDVSRFARRSLPAAAGPAQSRPIRAVSSLIGPTVRVTRGNAETAVPIGNSLAAPLRGFGPPAGMQPMQAAMVGGE